MDYSKTAPEYITVHTFSLTRFEQAMAALFRKRGKIPPGAGISGEHFQRLANRHLAQGFAGFQQRQWAGQTAHIQQQL